MLLQINIKIHAQLASVLVNPDDISTIEVGHDEKDHWLRMRTGKSYPIRSEDVETLSSAVNGLPQFDDSPQLDNSDPIRTQPR